MIHQAFAGALFEPRRQIARSVKEQPLASVLGAYLLAGISWVLSDFLIHTKLQAPISLALDTLVYLVLLTTTFGLGMMLLHFFAELLGGESDLNALFWGITQSATPLVLLVPLALASQWLGTMSGTVYLPGKLAIFLWVLACQVVAVSEACGLSVARSTYVFFLAYGAGLIGFLTLATLTPLAMLAKISLLAP